MSGFFSKENWGEELKSFFLIFLLLIFFMYQSETAAAQIATSYGPLEKTALCISLADSIDIIFAPNG